MWVMMEIEKVAPLCTIPFEGSISIPSSSVGLFKNKLGKPYHTNIYFLCSAAAEFVSSVQNGGDNESSQGQENWESMGAL